MTGASVGAGACRACSPHDGRCEPACPTLQSSAAKALKGLNIAHDYMNYGFTTVRDLGSVVVGQPSISATHSITELWRDRGSLWPGIF
jgi:hypothetical protein